MRRFSALAGVTLVVLACLAGVARADSWVRLTAPVMLQASPGDEGALLLELPVQDQEGLPTTVPVLSRAQASDQEWDKVRFGGQTGWIPAAAALPADAAALTPALRTRLASLLSAAGGRSGLQVAESGGEPLFSRNAGTARILASNTKLFVTGAAFAQLGTRISAVLPRILLPSNNVLAQGLLEQLGRRSAARGATLAKQFAASLGSRVQLADGSGLDRRDRSAPADVVRFLVGMRRVPSFLTWLNALPVAGRSGTLAGRMGGTPAAGACQAKTGTLHDVSTLSGYCNTASGRRIVFSILMNSIAPLRGRYLQDRMLAALVQGG